MQKSKYKHIIWDWNGTLLDDTEATIKIMNGILKKRNLPEISADYYKQVFDFPIINYYSRLGFDFSVEPFEKISDEFIEEYSVISNSCPLHENAFETIKYLYDSDISQSILSAANQVYLDNAIAFYGLKNYFIKLLGLNHNHATSKIDNGIKWVAELGCNPDEILLIGDTVHDNEVAIAIGCKCILVSHGHHSTERLRKCGVTVVDSLSDVKSFIG